MVFNGFWDAFWDLFGTPGPYKKQLKVCNSHQFQGFGSFWTGTYFKTVSWTSPFHYLYRLLMHLDLHFGSSVEYLGPLFSHIFWVQKSSILGVFWEFPPAQGKPGINSFGLAREGKGNIGIY